MKRLLLALWCWGQGDLEEAEGLLRDVVRYHCEVWALQTLTCTELLTQLLCAAGHS